MFARALRFTENVAVVSLIVASSAALHLAAARTERSSGKAWRPWLLTRVAGQGFA
jgi:hypothetical protein